MTMTVFWNLESRCGMILALLLLGGQSCRSGLIELHGFGEHNDFTGSIHQLESLGDGHLGGHYDVSHLTSEHEADGHSYGELLALHGGHSLDYHDDYDIKPVPGINHGKGVLSYSSTYEFMDHNKPHHHHHHS